MCVNINISEYSLYTNVLNLILFLLVLSIDTTMIIKEREPIIPVYFPTLNIVQWVPLLTRELRSRGVVKISGRIRFVDKAGQQF